MLATKNYNCVNSPYRANTMHIPSFPTYLSVYILTKSEFISSCIRPAVGLNIDKIICLTFFVNVFFFKWPPVAILDVQKSLLTISDQYHNLYFCDFFYKMAAGVLGSGVLG